MAAKFELYKDKKGEFRFRLKAGNGEIILASEGYKDRAGAENGIESVKKNSDLLARFEKKTSAATPSRRSPSASARCLTLSTGSRGNPTRGRRARRGLRLQTQSGT